MSDKYDSSEHIKVLAELNTLFELRNEMQVKINILTKELAKIDKLKKVDDEIPF